MYWRSQNPKKGGRITPLFGVKLDWELVHADARSLWNLAGIGANAARENRRQRLLASQELQLVLGLDDKAIEMLP